MMQIGMIIDDVLGLWFTSPKPPHLHHLSVVPIKQTIYLILVTQLRNRGQGPSTDVKIKNSTVDCCGCAGVPSDAVEAGM